MRNYCSRQIIFGGILWLDIVLCQCYQVLERGNKRTLKFNNIRKGCLAQHYLSKLLNLYVWTATIYLNCQTYLFKLPNLFVLISECICQLYQVQGGLLGKNLSAKGVLANFPTTLLLLLLKLYQVWSKIISTKPNVDSRTWLKSAFFPLKVVAIHNFFNNKTKQNKPQRNYESVVLPSSKSSIMHDHHDKIVSVLKSFLPMAFEFYIFIITKYEPSYLTFAK